MTNSVGGTEQHTEMRHLLTALSGDVATLKAILADPHLRPNPQHLTAQIVRRARALDRLAKGVR